MKRSLGWIYREDRQGVTGKVLIVDVEGQREVFADSAKGACEAQLFITATLSNRPDVEDGNNWKLEDMAFLGYRIFVEEEK